MARGNERGTTGGRGQDTRGRTAAGSAGQKGAEKRSADSARSAASTSAGRTSTGRGAAATGGSSGARGGTGSSVGRSGSTTGGATGVSAGGVSGGGVSGVTSGGSTVGSTGRRSGGVGGSSRETETDTASSANRGGSQASAGSVNEGLPGAVNDVDDRSISSVGGTVGGRSEQERQLSVSREGGQRDSGQVSTGQGRTQRTTGQGGAVTRPQVPALFSAPPELLAGAMLANPFEFMRRMGEEMNRALEDFGFGVPARSPYDRPAEGLARQGLVRRTPRAVWAPQIEAFQRGNEVVVRAELPGLSADDVNVEIEDGVLTISGERKDEFEDRNEGFYRSERSYGSFFRAIAIPEGVSEEDVTASFRDGVLELRIPLPEQQQRAPRRVPLGR